jgi:hypothetical protein
MKYLYCVRDNKANVSAPPFVARNDAEAARMFRQAVNDKSPENLLNRFAEDYELEMIGQFDEESGEICARANTTVVKAATIKEEA